MTRDSSAVAVDWKHGSAATSGKCVGIWIRVSTADQAAGESPENHEKHARFYAEGKGWTVAALYDLSAQSGKSVKEHPEAKRMMEDVRSGVISGLVFSKLARLGRDTKELLEFAEFFREHDADLISLAESIDTSTPAGRVFFTMIAALAQWEREEIADRVKASVKVRAKLGKSLGGVAPYGYRWENKVLVLDPDEAPIRREMFELFAQQKRLKTVASKLNEAGYRTRRGVRFHDTGIRRLLEDPIAKGTRRVNYSQRTAGGRWEEKPESEWIWQEVPAIVSPELWEECNQLLRSRKTGRRKPSRKTVHLFSGLAFCACSDNAPMYVPSWSKKYVCGKCRHKIPIADLEKIFQARLSSFLESPEAVAEALAESDQLLREKEELLAALVRERDKAEAEAGKTHRLYLDDQISGEGFAKLYRPLEERLTQLSDEIPRLEAETDVLKISHVSNAELVTQARDLYARFHELSFEEKRSIVETIVDRITIGTDEISFELISPTTPGEGTPGRGHRSSGSNSSAPGSPETAAKRQRTPSDPSPAPSSVHCTPRS